MLGTIVSMAERTVEVTESKVSEKGSGYSRYAPKAIFSELKHVVWPQPRKVVIYTTSVVVISLIILTAVHWFDQLLSSAMLSMLSWSVDVPVWAQVALALVQIMSALTSIVLAFKHPSPGDTLASIFGGEIVAQGSGLSPKEKRLERQMGCSVALFVLSTIAVVLVF